MSVVIPTVTANRQVVKVKALMTRKRQVMYWGPENDKINFTYVNLHQIVNYFLRGNLARDTIYLSR